MTVTPVQLTPVIRELGVFMKTHAPPPFVEMVSAKEAQQGKIALHVRRIAPVGSLVLVAAMEYADFLSPLDLDAPWIAKLNMDLRKYIIL